LHFTIQMKKICWLNFVLVIMQCMIILWNGVDGILKASTCCDKTIIGIMFKKKLIGTLTREKYIHYYNNIESKWTPIEPIIKNIRIGKSQSLS
jgi:hypothetical protein